MKTLSVYAEVRARVAAGLRRGLWLAGKNGTKVIAVFCSKPEDCDHAVRYVSRAVPDIPVWLFSTREVYAETAALCEQVLIDGNSVRLSLAAYKKLWRRWVALTVVAWTCPGDSAMKLAPFLIPPFRVLVMNEHRDFGSILRLVRSRILRDSTGNPWSLAWFLFSKLHGSKPLHVQFRRAPGAGVVRFDYRPSQLDWDEVRRLAAASDSRFLLLAEEGQGRDISDMLPLFDAPETFAVSRQPGLRPWKERVLSHAPFRRLQRGEVCQVLAPVAPVILVDREKLLALGLPQRLSAGAGWLLLFWKAAAAGLRSYSVVGDTELEGMREWPAQRAEFASRVLVDSTLLRLGPREPDLVQGNIARAMTGARPFRDVPRVLVVSPYLPYPLSHGGAVRIYNLCRALSNRVDFTLATFRERSDLIDYPKLHEVFREVYVVDRDEDKSKRQELPAQVREHRSRAMCALIAKLCREKQVDILQVEYTHMAGFRDAAPDVPAILVEHDLTFTLYRQLAEQAKTRQAWNEYRRWLHFERRALHHFNGVWVMSDADRNAALEHGGNPGRTFVVPNGVDLDRFRPSSEPAPHPEILYVGSFRHLPNVIGFEKLVHEVMPRVWSRFANARLRVVAGPEHEKYWRGDPDPRVGLHGFVEDLRPLYAASQLAVVPLLVSAGTNIKVMEALACGKALVTTPIGCAGLGLVDGRDALIREHWLHFADAIIALLADENLRDGIAAQGRRTAEERFGWQGIADQAYESYTALAPRQRGSVELLFESDYA